PFTRARAPRQAGCEVDRVTDVVVAPTARLPKVDPDPDAQTPVADGWEITDGLEDPDRSAHRGGGIVECSHRSVTKRLHDAALVPPQMRLNDSVVRIQQLR